MNHGIKVLKYLVETWKVKGYRVAAADSYFYSVKYEKSLDEMVPGIIGIVKKAPHQYPIAHLKRK